MQTDAFFRHAPFNFEMRMRAMADFGVDRL
jgi:hypothetical protein